MRVRICQLQLVFALLLITEIAGASPKCVDPAIVLAQYIADGSHPPAGVFLRESGVGPSRGDLAYLGHKPGEYAQVIIQDTRMGANGRELLVRDPHSGELKWVLEGFFSRRPQSQAIRPAAGTLEHFEQLALEAEGSPLVLTSKSGNHYNGKFVRISSDGQFIYLMDEAGNIVKYRVDRLDLGKTKIQEPIRGPPPPPPVQVSVSPSRALLPPPAVSHAQPAARAPPATFSSRVRIEGKSPSDAMRVIHEQGLEPKSAYVVQGVKYSFSELFDMGHGRVGTVAVIDMPDGSQVARVFYRSNSHSEFKVLPAINEGGIFVLEKGGYLPGYDKGVGQFSLSLPQELQAELSSSLVLSQPTKKVSMDSLKAIVRTHDELMDYRVYKQGDEFIHNKVRKEIILAQPRESPILSRGGKSISKPSDVQLKAPKDRPNFSRVEHVYTARTSLSGEVEVRVYQSASGELEYPVYIEKSTGRIWFGNVSNIDSPITDYGVRARAIDTGNLISPLWDYRQEIGRGYMGPMHPSDAHYASNWNYVREIPEVKRWYQEHGLVVPPPDP